MSNKTDINERFFVFTSKYLSSAITAPAVDLSADQAGDFDHYKLIRGEYENIHFPVVFRQEDGKRQTDIVDTGFAFFHLISDRLKNVLEENQFTGWKAYPAKIYDKKGKEIPGYHGFSVTGRCGLVKYRKESIIEKRLVPHGPLCRYYVGMHFDKSQWDRADFFLPEGRHRACITERVAKLLKKSKLTNVNLSAMAEIEVPERFINEDELI